MVKFNYINVFIVLVILLNSIQIYTDLRYSIFYDIWHMYYIKNTFERILVYFFLIQLKSYFVFFFVCNYTHLLILKLFRNINIIFLASYFIINFAS